MEAFFRPKDMVVIGVSEKEANLAQHIIGNSQRFGYAGPIYAVGRRPGTVHGVEIQTDLGQIPDHVELAVVLTPARLIPGILETCGEKGIGHIVIESGGFGELSGEADHLEQTCLEIARRFGMRIVGPNGIGTIDIRSGIMLAFSPFEQPLALGNISLLTQSGGVGIHLMLDLIREGQGLAKFVSLGNKMDLNEADFLEYLATDDDTHVITMYLEGISDGRRFLQAASCTCKPIVVFKSNVGQTGSKAAQSHTKALSSDDVVVDAAFRQVGITRIHQTSEYATAVKAFQLPAMKGNRVAVVSRSGGHAVITADALEKAGFVLPAFPSEVIDVAKKAFRASVIRMRNPMDVGDIFDFDAYGLIIEAILEHGDYDGLLFLNTYRSEDQCVMSRVVLSKIQTLSSEHQLPISCCLVIPTAEMSNLRAETSFPFFETPEEAVSALTLLRDHHLQPRTLFEAKPESAPTPQPRFFERKAETPSWLDDGTCFALLERRKIPVPKWSVAKSANEAAAAGETLQQPLVMKVLSPNIVHKTDAGAIALCVVGDEAIRRHYDSLNRAVCEHTPDATLTGMLLQEQAPDGVEVIIGGRRDPNFGPIVLVGLGGVFAEALKDVAIRIAPINSHQAIEMIQEIHGSRLLLGYRGQPKADLDALADIILAVSTLLLDVPEIEELDLNPVRVYPEGQGALVLDVRIRLCEQTGNRR